MRSFAVLLSTFFTSLVFAQTCPPPHIRQLSLGDKAIAEINLIDNRVRIVDGSSETLRIDVSETEGPMQGGSANICGDPEGEVTICDFDQGLRGLDLKIAPSKTLITQIKVSGYDRPLVFESGHFRIIEGGCGSVDQPKK